MTYLKPADRLAALIGQSIETIVYEPQNSEDERRNVERQMRLREDIQAWTRAEDSKRQFSALVLKVCIALRDTKKVSDFQLTTLDPLERAMRALEESLSRRPSDPADDGLRDRLNDGSDLGVQQQPDLAAPV